MSRVSELTGRHLDARVAEKVIGEDVYRWTDSHDETWFAVAGTGTGRIVVRADSQNFADPGELLHEFPRGSRPLAFRSSNIAAAWGVVQKMGVDGLPLTLEMGIGAYARFGNSLPLEFGETAPEAICRAALVTVEHHGRAA